MNITIKPQVRGTAKSVWTVETINRRLAQIEGQPHAEPEREYLNRLLDKAKAGQSE